MDEKVVTQSLVKYLFSQPIAEKALHVKKYSDLKNAVDKECLNPLTFSPQRKQYSDELIGIRDGKVSERIFQYLLDQTD